MTTFNVCSNYDPFPPPFLKADILFSYALVLYSSDLHALSLSVSLSLSFVLFWSLSLLSWSLSFSMCLSLSLSLSLSFCLCVCVSLQDALEENQQRKKQEEALREKLLAQEAKQHDPKVPSSNPSFPKTSSLFWFVSIYKECRVLFIKDDSTHSTHFHFYS